MRLCVCASAFWLCVACVRERSPDTSVADTTPHASIGAPVTHTPPDSLRLELEAPASVRVGEVAHLTLRIRNPGGAPMDLYLRGRLIAYDFVVRRADGTVAWQRLAGQVVPAIVQVKTLAPGDTLAFTDEWIVHPTRESPLAPGRYTVEGLLLRDQPEPFRTAPAALEVLPAGS